MLPRGELEDLFCFLKCRTMIQLRKCVFLSVCHVFVIGRQCNRCTVNCSDRTPASYCAVVRGGSFTELFDTKTRFLYLNFS